MLQMNNETELSEPLKTRGFRPIETEMVGDWATNEKQAIQLISERDISGQQVYIARVYDAGEGTFQLSDVRLLSESQAKDYVESARLALEAANNYI